jgi:hypothetical protein
MRATDDEIARLLARYKIAPLAVRGSDSMKASRGGRMANLCIAREDGAERLILTVAGKRADGNLPHDLAGARAIVGTLRSEAALPDDPSFEEMLADLLVKAAKLFEETGATRFELSSLRLHPTSYHIGKVTLLHDKPLHVKARLEPDSHDRRAVFDHRHGDSTRFPK